MPEEQQQVNDTAEKSEPKKDDATPEQQMAANLQGLLANFPGAPDKSAIDAWKAQYNDVFVSGFSDNEIYIWRSITRPEYVRIQKRAQEPGSPVDQYQLEESVCEVCVLWKSTKEAWAEGKAGTPNALSEQIMQNSNFLNPQAASMLVVKL